MLFIRAFKAMKQGCGNHTHTHTKVMGTFRTNFKDNDGQKDYQKLVYKMSFLLDHHTNEARKDTHRFRTTNGSTIAKCV